MATEPGKDRKKGGATMYGFRDWLAEQGRLPASNRPQQTQKTPEWKKPSKPNILWIQADQLRADTFGFMNHPLIQTPNLDKLAAQGAVYDNAYCSSPVCMPSRATMMTGKHLPEHGVIQNGYKMNSEMETFPQRIAEVGYRTANIGKTHCGRWSKKIFEYDAHVEDVFGATKPSKVPFDYTIYPGITFVGEPCDHSDKVLYGTYPGPAQTSKSYILATEACKWLYWHDDPRPFFLRVSFDDPHPPVVPPEPYASMYKPEDVPEDLLARYKESLASKPRNIREYHTFSKHDTVSEEDHRIHAAKYFGLVTHLDAQIGRILDYLDELGWADNTIVFFNSDHGHMIGEHGFTHKGAMLYEGVSKIPTVIRWPGKIAPGTRVDSLVEGIDVMPTLLELAGCDIPDSIEGKSIIPLAQGDRSDEKKYAFIQWYDYGFALRDNRYKLTWWDCDSDGELYDLQKDPLEKENLFSDAEFADKKKELLEALWQWREKTGNPSLAVAAT